MHSRQVQQVWREDAERGHGDACQRQQARDPGEYDDACDDRRRRQHDTDLERGGGEFEVVIFRGGEVALFLGVLGALGRLLGAFAGLRLGAVARRGLLPVVDLLLQRRLGGIVARAGEAYFALVGSRLHHGAADALGLEERPQVRGLDVLADGFGLRALAQRLRQRQEQCDDRDQQGDLLVGAGSVLGVLRMLHAFVGAHNCPPNGWPCPDATIDRTIWRTQGAIAFSSDACPALDAGWTPVRVKKTRHDKDSRLVNRVTDLCQRRGCAVLYTSSSRSGSMPVSICVVGSGAWTS